jgi:hypothetical protein
VPVANKRAGAAQEHCSLAADYRSAVQCRSVPSSPLSPLFGVALLIFPLSFCHFRGELERERAWLETRSSLASRE